MPISQKKSGFAFESIRPGSVSLSAEAISRLTKHPIAYFCAEYGIEDGMPIYAGGLGILAGDFILQASEENIPFVAIGLFYRKGFASYPKSVEGEGLIQPERSGFTCVSGKDGEPLIISTLIAGKHIFSQVWKKSWGSASLYLLDPNISKNSDEDRQVCTYLYPDSFEDRMSQEMILGIGGVALLHELDISPSIYHLNEGHTSFAALALACDYLKKHADVKSLAEAIEKVKSFIVCTKHTILPGAGIFFNRKDCEKYLESYLKDSGTSLDDFFALGASEGDVDIFSTTRFLLKSSIRANGVSKLHSLIEKETYPESRALLAITNGVNKTRWMIEGVDEASQNGIWQSRTKAKAELIEYIRQAKGVDLNPDSLIVVWARRMAEYKRPLLIFKDKERLQAILRDSKRPVAIIFSGNAYEGDPIATKLLEDVLIQIKSLALENILYLPHYSMGLSRILVRGADVWLNTPEKGKEASGTSSMKAGLNGALQISVADGWFEEVKSSNALFALSDENTAESLYEILESKVIPSYFDRDSEGYPREWMTRMKKTQEIILERYTTERMMREYGEILYFPEGIEKSIQEK